MIIVITGRQGSGKSTLMKHMIEKEFYGKVEQVTTRPKRDENDNDYTFVTDDEFKAMEEHNEFIEIRRYETPSGVWSYGWKKQNFSDFWYVAIGDPELWKRIKKKYPDSKCIYLDLDYNTRTMRCPNREANEWMRREKADDSLYSAFNTDVPGIYTFTGEHEIEDVSGKVGELLMSEYILKHKDDIEAGLWDKLGFTDSRNIPIL